MKNNAIKNAETCYAIEHWSNGYFAIGDNGHIQAHPQPDKNHHSVDFVGIKQKAIAKGLRLPLLLRFSDILQDRVAKLHSAFQQAIEKQDYQGDYNCIYPIKVNQQYQVVKEIFRTHHQHQVGLEAGSKPELLAVLGLTSTKKNTIICNGYKDKEYIRLALIGQQLGHNVFIIIEKLSELKLILNQATQMQITPQLGLRLRLATIAHGNWQNSGGSKAKFGLSIYQAMQAIKILHRAQALNCLCLLHCHMGSQIANIRDIQRGAHEIARHYAELSKLGVPITHIDIGGGLGIDYDGTRSRSYCSKNYSMNEYANNIVAIFTEICQQENLAHVNILTESGRSLTAHHAVLLVNIVDKEQTTATNLPEIKSEDPKLLRDLMHGFTTIMQRSPLEAYHDAKHWQTELQSAYIHGLLSMEQAAKAEQLFIASCEKIQTYLEPNIRAHREVLDELNELLAVKLFGNFSIFQSVPDIWAIQQIFPVIPLSGLTQNLTQRGILQDITCDSDGTIKQYVDIVGIENTMAIPKDCNLFGIFLVGAYQEILGDMHNLFGDTDSAHVKFDEDGNYELEEELAGNTVGDMLRYVNFDTHQLLTSYQQQLADSQLPQAKIDNYYAELANGLEGYTYLED